MLPLRLTTAFCSILGMLVIAGTAYVVMTGRVSAPPPQTNARHLYIELKPVGDSMPGVQAAEVSTLPSTVLPPAMAVVQHWTWALTEYYRHDAGATIADARAALLRVDATTNQMRFVRAQIALLGVKASRAKGESLPAHEFAHQARDAAEGMLRDVTASRADKQAAHEILAGLGALDE